MNDEQESEKTGYNTGGWGAAIAGKMNYGRQTISKQNP